ncbi:MAG: hypothetical protein LBT92_02040, partial [Rickettsiales bacterium]|nr:hypothetical protein [Rickettsiales bacterium]
RLNALGYAPPVVVRRGYRDSALNAAVGGSASSPHLSGRAADLADSDRALSRWCLDNLRRLGDCGLFMENPAMTPTWVHLQSRSASKIVFDP